MKQAVAATSSMLRNKQNVRRSAITDLTRDLLMNTETDRSVDEFQATDNFRRKYCCEEHVLCCHIAANLICVFGKHVL